MTTESQQNAVLSISTRDTQWLIAAMAMCNAMLNQRATEDTVLSNYESLVELCVVHYSGAEGDALMARLRALLPDETPLLLIDNKDSFRGSATSFIS